MILEDATGDDIIKATQKPVKKPPATKRKAAPKKKPAAKRRKISVAEKKAEIITSKFRTPENVLSDSKKEQILKVETSISSDKKANVELAIVRENEKSVLASRVGMNISKLFGNGLDLLLKTKAFSAKFDADFDLHENLGRMLAVWSPKLFKPEVTIALNAGTHIFEGVTEVCEARKLAKPKVVKMPHIEKAPSFNGPGFKSPVETKPVKKT